MARGTHPAAVTRRSLLAALRLQSASTVRQRSEWRGVRRCLHAHLHIRRTSDASTHPEVSIRSMLKPKPPRHPRDICLKLGSLHPSIYPDLGIHTRVCVQAVLERLVNDAARRIDEINARHEATAAEAASALSAESARVERAESEIAVLQANQTLPPLLLPVPPCRASVVPN